MSRHIWTSLRDWAGLIASIATVLFVILYPHGPSVDDPGNGAYRSAILDRRTTQETGGSVTAALVDGDAATDADGPATRTR